jgi:GNAT superfamily N-acetyltransferase
VISIREAIVSDIDWILPELKAFAEFYASEHNLFSDDDGFNRNTLRLLIENHYFMVSLDDVKPTGFMAALCSQHLFNPKIKTLTELFFWIKPEFRGSKSGSALLNDFVEFGKQFHWTIMTLEHNSPMNDSSILKRGFVYKEQSFIRESKVV